MRDGKCQLREKIKRERISHLPTAGSIEVIYYEIRLELELEKFSMRI